MGQKRAPTGRNPQRRKGAGSSTTTVELPGGPRPQRATRGDREGRLASWGKSLAEGWNRLLETPALWLSLFLFLGTWALMPEGLLRTRGPEAGSIAERDYIAPADLLKRDEAATRERQQAARDAVPPVYDYDPGNQLKQQLATLFEEGRIFLGVAQERNEGEALPPATITEVAGQLAEAATLKLTPEEAGLLIRLGLSEELEDRLQGLVDQVLRRGVVASKELLMENRTTGVRLRNLETGDERASEVFACLGYPEDVRSLVASEVRGWPGLGTAGRRGLSAFLAANLVPNLTLNSSETLARREAAAEQVSTVFNEIREGQVIVRKGDQVDSSAAEVIAASRGGGGALPSRLLPILGLFLLLALSALVVWLAPSGESAAVGHSPRRLFGEKLILLLLAVLGAKLAFVVAGALAEAFPAAPFDSLRSYAYAVPLAGLALYSALLMGRQTAFVLASIFCLLASQLVSGQEGLWVVIYGLGGSLAAIFSLETYQVKHRLVMTRVGLVVGVVNVIIVLLLNALAGGSSGGATQIGFDLLCAFSGGLLVAAVGSFTVPILEALFGIATDIKLVELSNTNLPLLRRLAYEAPGSFQHSLMVANLAKQACEAIGADSALAYAGGLYHDIGKVYRSEYFIENQRHGLNPHDGLAPSMSALILINHIKDGYGLARRHHLPQPILDAIEQHHGTRLITFFYNRALERCDPATEEVREEKYRYPGPKPQTRVMGVLMLADGVEAASRTLVEPSSAKIRGLIEKIVDDCLQDGQLDETDLTLKDLNEISKAFMRVLANIFHQRVDYPGFNFNGPKSERGEREESGSRAAVSSAARAS